MVNLLRSNPLIRRLELAQDYYPVRCLPIYEALRHCTHLRRLKVSGGRWCPEMDVDSDFAAALLASNLTELELPGAFHFNELFQALRTNTRLETLKLPVPNDEIDRMCFEGGVHCLLMHNFTLRRLIKEPDYPSPRIDQWMEDNVQVRVIHDRLIRMEYRVTNVQLRPRILSRSRKLPLMQKFLRHGNSDLLGYQLDRNSNSFSTESAQVAAGASSPTSDHQLVTTTKTNQVYNEPSRKRKQIM